MTTERQVHGVPQYPALVVVDKDGDKLVALDERTDGTDDTTVSVSSYQAAGKLVGVVDLNREDALALYHWLGDTLLVT